MKYWIKGGIIGVIIAIIFSLIALFLPKCCIIECIGGGGCDNILFLFLGRIYLITIIPAIVLWAWLEFSSNVLFYLSLFISSIIVCFIISMFVGFIIRMMSNIFNR